MKTYKIRSVQEHGQGDITILHSNGAFHYNEKDVTLKEWTNNLFCKMQLPLWNKILFYSWVIGLSVGFYFLFAVNFNNAYKSQFKSLDYTRFLEHNPLLFLGIVVVVFHLQRLIYFYRFRDFFNKVILYIHLKNNQCICVHDMSDSNYINSLFRFGFLTRFSYSLRKLANNKNVMDHIYISNKSVKIFIGYLMFIILSSISAYSLYGYGSSINFKFENAPLFYVFSLGMLTPVFIVIIFILLLIVPLTAFCWVIPCYSIFNSIRRNKNAFKSVIMHVLISQTLWLILFFEVYFHYHLNYNVQLFCFFILLFHFLYYFTASKNRKKIIFWGLKSGFRKIDDLIHFTESLSFLIVLLWPLILIIVLIIPVFILHNNYTDTIKFEFPRDFPLVLFCFLPIGVKSLFEGILINKFFKRINFLSKSSLEFHLYKFLYKNSYVSAFDIVDNQGALLEFLSKNLKNNDRIVLKAVKNNGLSLQFASEELRNDKEIVLEAINQNTKAIEFASIDLQNDTDIIEQLNKN